MYQLFICKGYALIRDKNYKIRQICSVGLQLSNRRCLDVFAALNSLYDKNLDISIKLRTLRVIFPADIRRQSETFKDQC